jgi:hypothetical protein
MLRPNNDSLNNIDYYSSYNIRRALVVFSTFLVIIYILYIQFLASSTDNWNATRLLGYAQTNLCNQPSYRYDILNNFTINTGTIRFYNLILK